MIRQITLEELVKRFNPNVYVDITCILTQWEELLAHTTDLKQALDSSTGKGLVQILTRLKEDCEQIGMPTTLDAVEEVFLLITSALGNSTITSNVLIESMQFVRKSASSELHQRTFLRLDPNHASLAFEPHRFGEKVDAAFPSVTWDIEEAARCLAFDRWTAAVFHLMRVAEIATVRIAERVGYVSDKPSFGGALECLDRGLELVRKEPKNADNRFVADSEWLKEVLENMRSVNLAWRQRVAHMEKKYTEEEAAGIWEATRSLMRTLANKLKEETG